MEKQKKWQLYLIVAVLALTIYNILPTVFFYSKPLSSPVDAPRAEQVAHAAIGRVNELEQDSTAWLHSFNNLLGVDAQSISPVADAPALIEVTFKTQRDADLFRKFLPKAGALIPFAPAQLSLYDAPSAQPEKVYVLRQVTVNLDPKNNNELFTFTTKKDEEGNVSSVYRNLVNERAVQLALAFGATSKSAMQMEAVVAGPYGEQTDEVILSIARDYVEAETAIGKSNSAMLKRFYSTFAQGDGKLSGQALVEKYLTKAETLKTKVADKVKTASEELAKNKSAGTSDSGESFKVAQLNSQKTVLESAIASMRKNSDAFKNTKQPLAFASLMKSLGQGTQKVDQASTLSLEGRNPYIEALTIDWDSGKIYLNLYDDIQKIRDTTSSSEAAAYQREKVSQLLINDIARAGRTSDENILPEEMSFSVNLNTLPNSNSFLVMNLGHIAEKQAGQLKSQLENVWSPSHPDLARKTYPIHDYASYNRLTPQEKKLGLVIYSPASTQGLPQAGFRSGSLYVIAKGMGTIIKKAQEAPTAETNSVLLKEVQDLANLLKQYGFIGYPGTSYGMSPEYSNDFIFEHDDFYANILKATREDFVVKGAKKHAILDFSNVEQRILALNAIDDREQEDLLKWKEEYSSAQVDLNATNRYLVPKPTKNPYWENFKLSFVKFFRGDDRKILKWGLDLSGGKTVRIGLRDHNNKPVTDPEDLKQAVNELYTRINKMGVSERTIHIENNNIILDFPGSQNMSASELIKASAMYFHIVNEKFSLGNDSIKDSVNRFLQGVWNEAVVTNRKDIQNINEIAWNHLGAESLNGQESRPRGEDSKILWDAGLRLANPKESNVSSAFDDTLSSIAMMRGDDFMEWNQQTHPLMVVFHNFALEGSSLDGVQVGYDPSQGNILSFNVKRSYEGSSDRGGNSPREDFYAWTSQFAEDKIAGTPKEAYTHGRGWRMAVILNGSVITSPSLNAALREGGMISGRFSQREVNQLAADLKAGSLTFTPKVLSEENVSPELGKEERTKGIVAASVAVLLVVVAMVGYYHFAGIVASFAVIINILIMWGVLQNIGAAITLPMIAGIVLTIGMAVDANVLVFERVREEFKISGRIASAIQAGYRKAFTAIFDSNITTIIAALILIQFDSGPIKGFAVSLIIGIVSSMFTALFMTRYFFAGWVQNPKHKELRMSQFIHDTHFNFLAQTKLAVILSAIVIFIGSFFFMEQRNTILGMDFTGGYSVVVDLKEAPAAVESNYRLATMDALLAQGATNNDVQVRELSRPTQLRVQLGMSMEEKDHPFYQMPETEEGTFDYAYQSNPRLTWVVNALQKAGLEVQQSQLTHLNQDWNVMSGQLSDTMRNNAIIALGVALLSILLYITIRFEFKYAIAAVIGLVHDVVITLGILALFRKLGFPVQIDLQVIGAIMTIIGYSLNDTIIVFDRIREDSRIHRKMKFPEIINESLNVTLSRTLMTSGTTLLVLFALVLLGGKSIFSFSLVMTIGVLVGTLSSLFIASPVLLYFHNRELKKEQERIARA